MFVLAEKHTSKVIGHTFAFSLLVVCGLFTTKGIVFGIVHARCALWHVITRTG